MACFKLLLFIIYLTRSTTSRVHTKSESEWVMSAASKLCRSATTLLKGLLFNENDHCVFFM